jgi:DNA-binding SARP family transcriptional activator
MPRLAIRLLGELAVLRDGRPLALPASKKTRALLGYLVACGGPQPRQRLCELLWEGPVDPRAALRWSLTKLRPLVDDGAAVRLAGDRERIAFAPEGADVDVHAIGETLAGGAGAAPTDGLRAAAARFQGEFLEGLELADCYRYREWLLAGRESWRAAQRQVLAALVGRLGAEPAAALPYARAWAASDPLDESAQAAVIRLLGELGQVREGLAQYESCRRMLAAELASAPSPALEEARRALLARRGRPAPDRSAAPPPAEPSISAAPLRAPELVGRAREIEAMSALLAASAAGHGGPVLLVAGEPGIGKSRLLAELAAMARARGGRVLYGRAFEAEMVRPYGAWIDALRSLPLGPLPEPLGSALAPLLPAAGPARRSAEPAVSAALAGMADRDRLFDAVVQLLSGGAAAGAPTAVVLDDLQWIDDASAALFHYAARAPAAARILFAAGARTGELADNPAARRLVRDLAREGRLQRLELPPLTAGEVALLVRTPAAEPSADAGARAFEESRGNPLFALEVARALGRGPAPGAELAESLGELLAERLSRLPERAAELLPWAAALGRGFALETLAGAAGFAPAALLAGIEELERHGILRAGDDLPEPTYDFAHDLIRRAAYRQLSAPRRRLVHRQIARALTARPDPDGALAGEVAHHAAAGGDDALAAAAAAAAGERSLRLFAFAEAAELAQRGLASLRRARGLPREARIERHLALLRVYVHSRLGRRRAAELEAELAALVEEAQEAGLHPQVQVGLYLLSVLGEESGDFAKAEGHSLHAAAAARGADPATALRALANTGRCLAQLEREPARAEALLAEAAARAADLGPQGIDRIGLDDLIDLPWGLGLTRLFAGDEAAAAAHLERALALARRAGDHWAEYECMARLAMIDLEAGRPAAALARMPALAAVADRLGEGSEGPLAAALDALARAALGEERVGERLEAALAMLRAIDTKGLLAYAQNLAAELDLAAGRPAEARRRAGEALAAASVVERRSQMALARAVLARAAMAAGDRIASRQHLAAAADDLAAPGRLSARARRALAEAMAAMAAVGSLGYTPP